MFELTGKVALVTGASRGIGRAIALNLAKQGAVVIAAARGDNAAQTVAAIIEAGGRAEAVSVDVTDSAALETLPASIVARHGRLDILVSNAGITRDQLLMRMKREDWDAVIATNLTATFTLTQAAMRPMHHCRQLGGGPDGERRADELRGVEGRADRVREGAGAGSGVARDHRQRDCARHDRH